MGGTFDPIHFGHLIAAELARTRFTLDLVIFVPTGDPPHKRCRPVSPAEHRYAMAVLATADHPLFQVSRLEMDRPGPSFSVDTLEEIRRRLGPTVDLYFITGADAISDMLTWKDPQRLVDFCHWVAISRPGYSLQDVEAKLGDFYRRHRERFHLLEVPGIAISSTDIRERVRNGQSIRYFVPEAVRLYIQKYALYQDGQISPKVR